LGRCAEPVDENGDAITFRQREFLKDRLHQEFGHRVGRCQPVAAHARLSVDAHADFHVLRAYLEVRRACLWQRAGSERNAHRAAIVVGKPRRGVHLVEILAEIGRRTGAFEDEENPGNAPSLAASFMGCRRNVVGNCEVSDGCAICLQIFCGHCEVQHIAGIVAVEKQDAGAAVRGAPGIKDMLGRGRGKDIADSRNIGEAPPT
jgi:hypothetical protein